MTVTLDPPAPRDAAPATRPRWTVKAAREIHDLPLTELLYRAQTVHRAPPPRWQAGQQAPRQQGLDQQQ